MSSFPEVMKLFGLKWVSSYLRYPVLNNKSLDWHLLQYGFHQGIKKCITDLNKLYKNYPALHQKQFSVEGFEWINYSDNENSVLAYIRKGNNEKENLIVDSLVVFQLNYLYKI